MYALCLAVDCAGIFINTEPEMDKMGNITRYNKICAKRLF
ncbi:hypothetical protein SALWKB12_0897 [Snodgrassella communis]|nr:hypothetical protein SALWKB12_0897 [Snodgrassella communis]